MSDQDLALEGEENELPEGEENSEGNEEENEGGEERSELELEAMAMGWSPDGAKEGRKSISAEEFIDRKPLYDKAHKTDRAMKRLEEQNKAITAHLEMVRKNMVESKVEVLKSRKRTVLEEQDDGWTDEVMQIDEDIVKAGQEEEIVVPETVDNSAYDQWLDNNQWYENNTEMKAYADKYGAGIFAQNPDAQLVDIYEEVAKEVQVRFADQFSSNRKRTSPVEGSRHRGKATVAKYTVKDLDDDAKSIMNNLVKAGVMTKAEYISDLEKTGYFNS